MHGCLLFTVNSYYRPGLITGRIQSLVAYSGGYFMLSALRVSRKRSKEYPTYEHVLASERPLNNAQRDRHFLVPVRARVVIWIPESTGDESWCRARRRRRSIWASATRRASSWISGPASAPAIWRASAATSCESIGSERTGRSFLAERALPPAVFGPVLDRALARATIWKAGRLCCAIRVSCIHGVLSYRSEIHGCLFCSLLPHIT
jgi:hypothetical protein